jgi:hypothetical protein
MPNCGRICVREYCIPYPEDDSSQEFPADHINIRLKIFIVTDPKSVSHRTKSHRLMVIQYNDVNT